MRWLLAFGRCQRLAPANIAINDLVTSIVESMRPTLAENISINVELGEGVGHACGPGAARRAILETVTRRSVSYPTCHVPGLEGFIQEPFLSKKGRLTAQVQSDTAPVGVNS